MGVAKTRTVEKYRIIHDFVRSRGHCSLYDYLKLPPKASEVERAWALDHRLSWAEQHRGMPEFKHEAQWLLLNHLLLVRALLDAPQEYRSEVAQRRQRMPVMYDLSTEITEEELVGVQIVRPDGDSAGSDIDDVDHIGDLEDAGEDGDSEDDADTAVEETAEGEQTAEVQPPPSLSGPTPLSIRERTSRVMPLLLTGWGLILVMLVSIRVIGWLMVPALPSTHQLIVRTNPPTGTVYIDGKPVGTNGYAHIHDDGSRESVEVRVEASGFQAWSEITSLSAEQTTILTPELNLVDPMNYRPASTDTRGETPAALKALIGERERFFNACFDKLNLPAGTNTTITVRGYITSMGVVGKADISGQGAGDPMFEHCMRSQLRALSLPYQSRDYAPFQHTFSIQL